MRSLHGRKYCPLTLLRRTLLSYIATRAFPGLGLNMRCILSLIAACAVALSVAGCSTGAQQEATHLKSVAGEYKAESDACNQKIADNPEYSPLKSKTVVDGAQQFTLQMLNDKTSPNKRDISLLNRLYGDYQECRKFFMESVSQTLPLSVNAFVELSSDTDKLWVQATAGRLTWSQFNQGRKDLVTRKQEELNQATAQVNSQLQQANQAELAQRRQAVSAGLQSIGNAYANMPVQSSPPPPPPTPTIQCNTLATGRGNSTTTCQ